MLDRLVTETRAGRSRVLVLRGEAGIGKTALLGYLSRVAQGCRIARVAGIESEMELAFAGLHALCAPMLDRLGRLPVPQRDALTGPCDTQPAGVKSCPVVSELCSVVEQYGAAPGRGVEKANRPLHEISVVRSRPGGQRSRRA